MTIPGQQSHLERLLALLPRIYAAQPRTSVLGHLLWSLAGELAAFDAQLERVMRDHWVALAGSTPLAETARSPVELLGRLLDVERMPGEKAEAFRRRLHLMAPVITRGLTTPRSLLALAAITLGTEPCPRLQQKQDTTLGWGMRPGTRARCSTCKSNDPGPCASPAARLLEARLTDNPAQPRLLTVPALAHGQRFTVRSHSLELDLPVLTIKAKRGPVVFPALHNLHTQEVTLYAGTLEEGETLTVQPRIEQSVSSAFDGFDAVGHHPWRLLFPSGRAFITGADGKVRDAAPFMYYLLGHGFDGTEFAPIKAGEPRFAILERKVLTPKVRHGSETWIYLGYTLFDIVAVAGTDRVRDFPDVPLEPEGGQVDVNLEWWTRSPATFRLRVPRNAAVGDAEAWGGVALLRRSVARARAAGVQALVDLPPPALREDQRQSERVSLRPAPRLREHAGLAEGTLAWRGAKTLQVRHGVQDIFAIGGIFDVTRLDWSRLAP